MTALYSQKLKSNTGTRVGDDHIQMELLQDDGTPMVVEQQDGTLPVLPQEDSTQVALGLQENTEFRGMKEFPCTTYRDHGYQSRPDALSPNLAA